jgi:pilus assembly protein CpaC
MMLRKRRNRTVLLLLILVFFLIYPVASMADGPERIKINSTNPENLTVAAGKSIILESETPIKRFSVAESRIADIIVLTPWQVYLTGKSSGVTSICFWGKDNKLSTVFDVEVTPDVVSLKNKLHQIFPNEKNIQVAATQNSIILSGDVSNAATMSQMLSVAGSYVPSESSNATTSSQGTSASGSGLPSGSGKQKLINLLEVGGVQQVMLEVRVSEMSKSLIRQLGINFSAIGRQGRDGSLSFVSTLVDPTVNPLSTIINGTKISQDVTFTALIDALEERDLLKVLAAPTLITMSGKKANFLAGGEYPIPVPGTATSSTTIEYKTYGVALNFLPTVLGKGRINMEVAPEVSDLDYTNAVSLSGYVVPGLTLRRVSTNIELADGQSFAIAGLLKYEVKDIVKKFPFFGDIPVLGALFKSSDFQKNQTELVIIVTPHIVKPVDLAKQTLPTDQYIEPNDLEFYGLGFEEGIQSERQRTFIGSGPSVTGSGPSVTGGGGLDGDFGHIIP